MQLNRRSRAIALALAGLAIGTTLAAQFASAAVPPPAGPWDRQPTNEEYGLLVMANMARSDPSLFPRDPDGAGPLPTLPPESPRLPFIWNDALATAARFHSMDMAEHGCFQHNSCNGKAWDTRIRQWYPGNSAENIGSGANDPLYNVAGWMNSAGHRANILGSAVEFGGGIAVGHDGFGPLPVATADFGNNGLIAVNSYPVVLAATVLPPQPAGTMPRDVRLSYYDYLGRNPDTVHVVVGASKLLLTQVAGNATNRIYGATRTFPLNACVDVYYEVRRGGQTFRWPETGTITVAPHDFECGGDGDGDPEPPGTSTTTLAPSNSKPQVFIDAPFAGLDVTGTIEIIARAEDPDGIARIRIEIDGNRIVQKNAAVIARKWNAGAKRYAAGETHTITVRAWDKNGKEGFATIVVNKP